MQLITFNKQKYDNPLQMDFLLLEEIKDITNNGEIYATDFFEIIMFTEEIQGFVFLDEHKISLQKGTLLFISPYQKRRWFVDENKIKGYALIFEKDFLATFFSDELFVYKLQYFYNHIVPPYFQTNKKIFSFDHNIFEEIHAEISHYKSDSEHLLRSILYYMLIKINRAYAKFHSLKIEDTKSNYAFLFKEALEKNFKTYQQVNDYVGLLNISRITLNKATQKQFGITASELIKDRIISEIQSKLLHSTLTITEIAFQLNFSDSNNMIRFFKNRVGVTPSRYRLSYQIDS